MSDQTYQEWLKKQKYVSSILDENPAYEINKYKYVFFDWFEGRIETKDLDHLYSIGKLSKLTLRRIRAAQRKAFIKFVGAYLELMQEEYIRSYSVSLLKSDHLTRRIDKSENIVNKIKTENQSAYLKALDYYENGTVDITPTQLKSFFSDKDSKGTWIEHSLYFDFEEEYNTPVSYIVEANFLTWLYWFRDQRALDKTEPLINISTCSYTTEKGKTLKRTIRKLSTQPISYRWQGPPESVDILFNLLIQGGYIPNTTEIDNFRALFAGKPLKKIKPLKWLQNTNLLAYLIDMLYDNNMFPDDTNYWSIAEACFTDTKNLKQLKSNYLDNKAGKPKGFRQIDSIIATLEQFTEPLPVNF